MNNKELREMANRQIRAQRIVLRAASDDPELETVIASFGDSARLLDEVRRLRNIQGVNH